MKEGERDTETEREKERGRERERGRDQFSLTDELATKLDKMGLVITTW